MVKALDENVKYMSGPARAKSNKTVVDGMTEDED